MAKTMPWHSASVAAPPRIDVSSYTSEKELRLTLTNGSGITKAMMGSNVPSNPAPTHSAQTAMSEWRSRPATCALTLEAADTFRKTVASVWSLGGGLGGRQRVERLAVAWGAGGYGAAGSVAGRLRSSSFEDLDRPRTSRSDLEVERARVREVRGISGVLFTLGDDASILEVRSAVGRVVDVDEKTPAAPSPAVEGPGNAPRTGSGEGRCRFRAAA